MTERELRSDLLNTLLTTPHRDLSTLCSIHEKMIEQDPLFYVHMAAWYADHGQVRDHKEMFVIMLCLSSFEGHREVGLALLRQLPPYEVARVVSFIKGSNVRQRVPKQPRARRKKQEFEIVTKNVGLFRNVPRSMHTEILRYLREREADTRQFDRTVMVARRSLKNLYASLHITPSPRAQAILFEDNPPTDSLAFVVKQIAQAHTPAEQARAIVEHRIPYRVASGLIKEMSPMVLAALIEVMTPQEVINNISSMKKHGAFNNPDIKQLVDAKISAAKGDKRVSAYKAKVAVEAAGVKGELAEALESVTEARVKAAGKITRSTALLIDKSGSMEVAIEVGKQLGALISAICDAELIVYAFDTVAYTIEPRKRVNLIKRVFGQDQEAEVLESPSLADWENALHGIHAGGQTSCGIAIDRMRQKRQSVEQIVMVTDEGENTAPRFQDAYQQYASEMNQSPSITLVKVGGAVNQLEFACTQLGVAPQVFEFQGDYYSLPNVIPLLTYPSLAVMVMEILDYPLPQRKPS
jgi:hypothetical protein